VCAVLFLLQFSRIVQVQYDLASKTGTRDQLLRENAELQLRIEQLSALNRVEQQALRLGMVHPESWLLLELPQLARQGLDGEMASAGSHRVAR
jgi:cell division protein FtsL